jgi:hypothetical protein
VRGRGYRAINVPIRLQLEFEFLTAAELSNILSNYQRMLRAAWRETLHDQHVNSSPAVRVVVTRASSASPLEVWVDYVLPAIHLGSAMIGPVKNWPAFVKVIFEYVRALWSALEKGSKDSSSDRIVITGGSQPQLNIPLSALRDRRTAQEIKNLWSVAQKGRIKVTMKLADTDESISYKTD